MLIKTEEDLLKLYKANGIHGLCLLYSAETYLMEAWRKKLLEPFGEEGFNMQSFDGKSPDLDKVYDATQALPVFASEKCVLIDDIHSKMNAEEQKKLLNILEDLPNECMLLITARAPNFDIKSAFAKKLLAAAAKSGTAIELSARSAQGLVKFIQQTAKKNKCEIPASLCHEILRVCDNNMNTLASEINKLCAYADGGEIQKNHLEILLTQKIEAKVFDLAKMILAGNAQRAMEILDNLFYLREEPILILSTLVTTYIDLYRARVAKNSGATPAEVIAGFGYKGREFRVNSAFGTRISPGALQKSIFILAQCDKKLKSSGIDNQILVQKTVTELIGVRNEM